MLLHSTRDMPADQKLRYWNAATSKIFNPIETRPHDATTFDAELSYLQVGRVTLARAISGPGLVVNRINAPAYRNARKFLIQLNMNGPFKMCQDGREADLDEGDFTICDTSHPFTIALGQTANLILIVDSDHLREYFPCPEQTVGIRLSGKRGFSSITSKAVSSLWEQAVDGLLFNQEERVVGNILDMITTSWLMEKDEVVSATTASDSRRIHITRYIEDNLRDPELAAPRIAAQFGISVRYLHKIFSLQKETVCDYILRRRLEQCAKQFLDPLWRKRTITEIAFGWGFNSANHFSRSFRALYGLSPRDFRKKQSSPH